MQRFPIAAAAAALPASTLAHPGHDHAHWSSAAAHGLFFLGIVSATAVAVWLIGRRRHHANPSREQHAAR